MLLDNRLRGIVEIQGQGSGLGGRPYYEANLVSDDGQTLFLYEGQLKEVSTPIELGARYEIEFRPFVNNRWLELKISSLERVE